MKNINERIEELKQEIKAEQANPQLGSTTYRDKLKELMKLRRQQTRKGSKNKCPEDV
jgi:hypothetical protein